MAALKKDENFVKIKQVLTHNSICYNNKSIITNALILKNVEEFFFPVFIDWRGRYYTKSASFSYQGNDLAKSLFLYKNGVILNENGLIRLKLYIGICYGLIGKASNCRLE